jgi:hypothetical protein
VSVEPGDDTRRPAAELSGAREEENGAPKARDRHIVGVRVSCHRQSLTPSGLLTEFAVPTGPGNRDESLANAIARGPGRR